MLTADRQQRFEIAGMPVEMHWQDRLGARRDRALDEPGIQVEGGFVDIDIDRFCAAKSK